MKGISLVLYHLYWVAIGIIFNPTWGLYIFNHCLVHCCLIRCHLQDVDHCKSTLFLQHASICSAGFLVLCFAITSQVITGKSFRGRQTADDVLKSAILSVIGVVS